VNLVGAIEKNAPRGADCAPYGPRAPLIRARSEFTKGGTFVSESNIDSGEGGAFGIVVAAEQ
jgi:hypothetical protein